MYLRKFDILSDTIISLGLQLIQLPKPKVKLTHTTIFNMHCIEYILTHILSLHVKLNNIIIF